MSSHFIIWLGPLVSTIIILRTRMCEMSSHLWLGLHIPTILFLPTRMCEMSESHMGETNTCDIGLKYTITDHSEIIMEVGGTGQPNLGTPLTCSKSVWHKFPLGPHQIYNTLRMTVSDIHIVTQQLQTCQSHNYCACIPHISLPTHIWHYRSHDIQHTS